MEAVSSSTEVSDQNISLFAVLLYCDLILTDNEIYEIAARCRIYHEKTSDISSKSIKGTLFEKPFRDRPTDECPHFKRLVEKIKIFLGAERYNHIIRNLVNQGHLSLAYGMAPSFKMQQHLCIGCESFQAFHRFCFSCGLMFNVTDYVKEKYTLARNSTHVSPADEVAAVMRGNNST